VNSVIVQRSTLRVAPAVEAGADPRRRAAIARTAVSNAANLPGLSIIDLPGHEGVNHFTKLPAG
jgi:translation initiation factor IF-2